VFSCLSSAVVLRRSGDSAGGVVGEAGGVPHPVRGGGKGLPPRPGAAPAAHRLLELPRERGGHQVRTREPVTP